MYLQKTKKNQHYIFWVMNDAILLLLNCLFYEDKEM